MRTALSVFATVFLVSACDTAQTGGDVTRATPTAAPVQPMETDAEGHCFAREITPAVYDQVPGQVQVVPAQLDADGTVLHPPIYRNAPVPRLVKPRGETRFRAPCPDQMTPAFIATLQRALYARGYLRSTITGRLDAPTEAALRQYQRERGLDSAQLSLDSARELGIVAVDRDAL